MSERSTSGKISDVVDQLVNIRHLNEAIFMAAADSSLTTQATDALQSVSNIIDDRLQAVEAALGKLMEELR